MDQLLIKKYKLLVPLSRSAFLFPIVCSFKICRLFKKKLNFALKPSHLLMNKAACVRFCSNLYLKGPIPSLKKLS